MAINKKQTQPKITTLAVKTMNNKSASQIAKSLGFSVGAVSGHTAWWLFPTFYMRELYGILYQAL